MMLSRWGLGFAAFALCCAAAEKPVDFARDVRPILSDNCFTCHGPDEKQRMAKLRFDVKDGGIDRTVVAGDASKSKLYQRISAANKAMRMPPPSSTTKLTDQQIATVKRWIDEGAKWQDHWAYAAPVRPDTPKVSNPKWARNAIDNFVLARLDKEGLKPASEADKATLLRRVTLDLTGLPPTPEEVRSFVADKSPDAYEKRVDQLLRSKHYGERMAMQWLDLARYSDTHGYHIDSHRDMWHWRDWVIKAYNENLPFDRFTVWQIAGDLLPNATMEQKIATGFNRNHMINFEGGAIPEEYLVEYVVDRVETTSTVWMGATMGCARCHDHKYDPIRQKDFYRFFAFFNNVPEKGLDGRAGNAEPVLQLPSEKQAARKKELEASIKTHEAGLPDKAVAAALTAWESKAQLPGASNDGLVAHYEFDGNLADSSGHYHHGRSVTATDPGFTAGQVRKAVEFGGESQVDFGSVADFQKSDKFGIAVWIRPGDVKKTAVFQNRGYELLVEHSKPIGDLKRGSQISFRMGATVTRTARFYPLNEWRHVAVNYNGSRSTIYVDGKLADCETLSGNADGAEITSLKIGDKKGGFPYKGRIDDLRLYGRELTSAQIEDLALRYPIKEILAESADKRSKEEQARAREYFLSYAAPEPMRTTYCELTSLKAELTQLNKDIPTTMVMAEMPKPRDTWVLGRGDYRNHGEKVTPGVPAFLPPLAKDVPPNRLALAKWLVDPANPLTARVAVNRYWQSYFGIGLVKTAEDFGSQGEAPSHPELLDWLATEFVRTGWDVRGMQRLIVTSAAYRQSSHVTPELHERDPENRLLARGPRYRMPAEMVRDIALASGGLLDGDRIGGPSVLPYQPPGLWEEMAFGDVYSAQAYVQSHGRDLYRRSMYTFWKRTVPPASMSTFDAPDREKCTARRSVTNTPLQALVMLNDPTYVEAARALAQRAMLEGGKDASRRLGYAFELVTGRAPSKRETQVLVDMLKRADANPELLKVGESEYNKQLDAKQLAAYTVVASAILNLDETITKE